MVQLESGKDVELNIGGSKGIFVYIEPLEDGPFYHIKLTISDGTNVSLRPGKVMLSKGREYVEGKELEEHHKNP